MPGCSAIGGAPQQAYTLQLRIDVHHPSELLTALDARRAYMSGRAAAARCYMTRTADALRASWSGGAAGTCPAALPSVEHLSKRGCFSCTSACTTRRSCSRLSMLVSYPSRCRCSAMLHDQDG